MTERAVSITPPELGELNERVLGGYDRVYLGSEFCQHLLPSLDEVRALKDKGVEELTVLTPLLPTAQLRSFLKLFGRILKLFPRAELSLGDLGLMRAVNRAYGGAVPLLLARPVSADFIRMDEGFLERFFSENNLRLLETDEPDRVAAFRGGGIKFSFHYPFKYLAMTRLCPFVKGGACSRACAGKTLKIQQTAPYRGSFLLKNNTYFSVNGALPPEGVARTVFALSAGPRREKLLSLRAAARSKKT
ncbi:MAG: hypothetical protein AB7V08_03640 [Elusimicrobiales bacterium]